MYQSAADKNEHLGQKKTITINSERTMATYFTTNIQSRTIVRSDALVIFRGKCRIKPGKIGVSFGDPYKKKFIYKLGKCVVIDTENYFVVRGENGERIAKGKKEQFNSNNFLSGAIHLSSCLILDKSHIILHKSSENNIKFYPIDLKYYSVELSDLSIPLKCMTKRIIHTHIIGRTVHETKKIIGSFGSISLAKCLFSWFEQNSMTPCHIISENDIEKLNNHIERKNGTKFERERGEFIIKKMLCDLSTK